MCGQKTNSPDGQLLAGYITINSINTEYYGVMVEDLYEVGCYAERGDSGGVVFEKNGSTAKVAGIQMARDNYRGSSHVCKAKHIVSTLGVDIR